MTKSRLGLGHVPNKSPKKTPHDADAEMISTPQMGDGWCSHQPQYKPIFCWQFGVLYLGVQESNSTAAKSKKRYKVFRSTTGWLRNLWDHRHSSFIRWRLWCKPQDSWAGAYRKRNAQSMASGCQWDIEKSHEVPIKSWILMNCGSFFGGANLFCLMARNRQLFNLPDLWK